MGNHVIYDAVWRSKKLARCSREAALAYPTIFLVCDEWGRFEYRPHLIHSQVFSPRQDFATGFSVEDVAGWMAEYDREGLLIRYHIEGELAVWTKFKGRPPAKRRKSDLPDPRKFPEYQRRLTEIQERDRKPAGRQTEGSRKVVGRPKEATSLRRELETRARAGDKSKSIPAAPEVTLVPALSWSNDAADDWIERHGGKPPGAMFKGLGVLVPPRGPHSWSRVRPVLRFYLATRELDFLSWPKFASGFGTLESEMLNGASARASPKAQARQDSSNAMILGGLRAAKGLGRGDEGSGDDA